MFKGKEMRAEVDVNHKMKKLFQINHMFIKDMIKHGKDM